MCEDQSKFEPMTYASYLNRLRCQQERNAKFTLVVKGKENKTMRDTLPNGAVVEGTLEQVNAIRRSLGYDVHFTPDGVHYKSSTRGVVRIADMDTNHIKNAARKLFSNSVSSLDTRASLADFLMNLQSAMRDVTLIGLLQQLQLRQARGEK